MVKQWGQVGIVLIYYKSLQTGEYLRYNTEMNEDTYYGCITGDRSIIESYIEQDPLNWVRACFVYFAEQQRKHYHGCAQLTVMTMEPFRPRSIVWDPQWFDLTNNSLGTIEELKTRFGHEEVYRYHPYWYQDEHLWDAMATMIPGSHQAMLDFSAIPYTYVTSQRFHWKLIQLQSKQAFTDPTPENIQIWKNNAKYMLSRYQKDLSSQFLRTKTWLAATKTPLGEHAFFQIIPEAPFEGFKKWLLLGHHYPLASYGAYHLIEKRVQLKDPDDGRVFIKKLEATASSLNMQVSSKDKEVLQWVIDTALSIPSNFEQSLNSDGQIIATLGAVELTLPYLRTGSFAPTKTLDEPSAYIDFNPDFSM